MTPWVDHTVNDYQPAEYATTHPSPIAGNSQSGKILRALKEAWPAPVDMPELARLSGSLNVHSRIADLRRHGWTVEQITRREGREIHSSYRIVMP